MTGPIPFFQHDLGQPELDAVREVLSGPILTTGATVERVERRLAEYLQAKHLLAVTSCTGAMHLSLLALGVGPGDEVITTPMTFIATSTATEPESEKKTRARFPGASAQSRCAKVSACSCTSPPSMT